MHVIGGRGGGNAEWTARVYRPTVLVFSVVPPIAPAAK